MSDIPEQGPTCIKCGFVGHTPNDCHKYNPFKSPDVSESIAEQFEPSSPYPRKELNKVYLVMHTKYNNSYGCDITNVVGVCSTEQKANEKCESLKKKIHNVTEGYWSEEFEIDA